MIKPVVRIPGAMLATGWCRTGLHVAIKDGRFPVGFKLNPEGRAVGWAEHEVEAVVNARNAGKSNAEIRALVDQLHAARLALA